MHTFQSEMSDEFSVVKNKPYPLHTHTHTRCLSPQLTRAAQDVRLVVVTTVAQQHVKHVKREKALKCCALFVCYHLPTKGLQLSEGDC